MGRWETRGWWAATLLACVLVNPYVRGDGNGYYAWLVSPVIDGDLDFTNQYRRADPLFQTLIFDADGAVRSEAKTGTGRVINQWSVGPALLWAPAFLVAHAGVRLAGALGSTVPADGYSWPYVWLVATSTALYGMLALWWSVRVATALGYERGAGLAVVGIGLASSLPVYQVFLPFHVHALAACSVAAFVAWGLVRGPIVRISDWAVWGALAGLMVEVYHPNGVFLLAAAWACGRTAVREGIGRAVRSGVSFAIAAAVVCLPQAIGKAMVYGRPWITGYQDQFFWSEPRLWQTLLSANHGWVLWTPVVALALVGLVRVWRDRPAVRPFLMSSVCFYALVASYQNWHGQSSFGNRFFVSLTVVLIVGLAAGAEWARRRGPWTWRALGATVAALVVWNAGFAFQWGTNIIPNLGPVRFRAVAVNQVTVVPARVCDFAGRYFGDRVGTQRDVERVDERERRDHQVVR